MDGIVFSDFTVQVFINHDPFIATVLLPNLFRDFPDSAWRLPQAVPVPARLEDDPTLPSGKVAPYVWLDERSGLGRYCLYDTASNSTTLLELLPLLEKEFDLNSTLLAHFTIFPQPYQENGTLSKWHEAPLPWNMTLGEVMPLDEEAVIRGYYAGVPDQYAPILQLVIETKAAALRRCLAGDVDTKMYARVSGKEFEYITPKYQRDNWDKLACFKDAINVHSWSQDVGAALTLWRTAFYSLRYLYHERAKFDTQGEGLDETIRHRVMADIEKMEQNKKEAKKTIATSAREWEQWILKQDYSGDYNSNDTAGLQDDQVEQTVAFIFRQRMRLMEWSNSTFMNPLQQVLQEEHSAHVDDPIPNGQHQIKELLQQESGKNETKHFGEVSMCISNVNPFRLDNGTLDRNKSKFTIKSGLLSWGHVLPIYHGSRQNNLTNRAAETAESLKGGTILQHRYTYKSAARVGDWKVRRYYGGTNYDYDNNLDYSYNPDGINRHMGWVVCHEDVDPWDIIQKVRALGLSDGTGSALSNRNLHIDKDVRFIGRYDWGYHWRGPTVEFEDEFYEWAKPVLEKYKQKPIRQFRQHVLGRTHTERFRENQDIVLEIISVLEQVLLIPSRPATDVDIPLISECIRRLENIPESDAHLFVNDHVRDVLWQILKLKSTPSQDEFDILKRVHALFYKYNELRESNPTDPTWYLQRPVVGKVGVARAGYFIAMDSEDFDIDFIKMYRHIETERRRMQEFSLSKGKRSFGTYLSLASPGDEFAWLVFSGKRHADHDGDELIAIVYDPSYHVFAAQYHGVEP